MQIQSGLTVPLNCFIFNSENSIRTYRVLAQENLSSFSCTFSVSLLSLITTGTCKPGGLTDIPKSISSFNVKFYKQGTPKQGMKIKTIICLKNFFPSYSEGEDMGWRVFRSFIARTDVELPAGEIF
jgi:hypothetical protein